MRKTVYIITISVLIVLGIGIFFFNRSRRKHERNLRKLSENFYYMIMVSYDYWSNMGRYPFPSWLFENLLYFDSYVHEYYNKLTEDYEGENIEKLKRWDQFDDETKMSFLKGEREIPDNMKHYEEMWLIRRKGNTSRFAPFWEDVYWNYSFNELRYELDIERFKDPFSPSGQSIRYTTEGVSVLCFISNGPDGDKDIDEKDIYGYHLHGEYQSPDINLLYDPTNGIKSNGDIYIDTLTTASDLLLTIRSAPALRDIDFDRKEISEKWKNSVKEIRMKQYPDRDWDNFEW